MVHTPDAALAGSNPQSSVAVGKERIDRAAGNLMGDKFTAGSAKTNQATRVQAGPHVAGTVLRERLHRGRDRGSWDHVGGTKGSPSVGRAIPMAHAVGGTGPNVAAGVLENSQNHRIGQPVANGIDPLRRSSLQFAGVRRGRIACHPGAACRPPGALTILQEGLAYAPGPPPELGTRSGIGTKRPPRSSLSVHCPVTA